jgi:hypothetical protein
MDRPNQIDEIESATNQIDEMSQFLSESRLACARNKKSYCLEMTRLERYVR